MLETNQTIIKYKLGLLNLAEDLGNVSKACKVMGLSRDTFYRYKAAVDEGGVDALINRSCVLQHFWAARRQPPTSTGKSKRAGSEEPPPAPYSKRSLMR